MFIPSHGFNIAIKRAQKIGFLTLSKYVSVCRCKNVVYLTRCYFSVVTSAKDDAFKSIHRNTGQGIIVDL